MMERIGVRIAIALCLSLLAAGCGGRGTGSKLVTTSYDQAPLSESHNWAFRRRHPEADRLFNGFDYGHAIAYETLLRNPAGGTGLLERDVYRRVTEEVLRSPPRFPLEEHAVGPTYAALVPEVEAMFAWSHMLHRQLYDILADPRIAPERRAGYVRELLRYYHSRRDLAFSAAPKSMALMEGQPYSLAFRRASPKYGGLLWSYHWLQMAMYDALLSADRPDERRRAVHDAVAHFWALLEEAPARMPEVMPMSAAVAPRFTDLYPEASIIFDNMHALHDVVADVLSTPSLGTAERRRLILVAASAYRDSTTAVTSREEWRAMAEAMGAGRMGGVARPGTPHKHP